MSIECLLFLTAPNHFIGRSGAKFEDHFQMTRGTEIYCMVLQDWPHDVCRAHSETTMGVTGLA